MKIITLQLSVTNCFLIKINSKYILIDTGYEYDWELFCKRLKAVNVGLPEISHIILTHHHDDHCGLLNQIIKENPSIQVVMSTLAQDLLSKGKNDETHGGGLINHRIKLLLSLKQVYLSMILKKPVDPESNLIFPPYQVRRNDILVSGETKLQAIGIDLPGWIVETPGHSIDSISIIFDDGDCFMGDAAANFLQFAGTKYCVIFVTDLEEYYRSWRKVISVNAQRIFPGHGKPFGIEKLRKNLDQHNGKKLVKVR